MIVTTKVTIDLNAPSSPATIYVVQGDSSTRYVEVSLFSDGEAWQIPSGVSVSMRYSKPDYTAGYYDTMPDGTKAWTFQGNTITMQLAPQMLTVAGTVTAQLELLLNNATLGTFSFYISVQGNPAADTVTSENYVNWLQWMKKELDKYIHASNGNTPNGDGSSGDTENGDTESGDTENGGASNGNGQLQAGPISSPVDMNGNRLFNLPQPVSDTDAAPFGLVRRAAPWNLLDNSDFTNPVNQRGATNYTPTGTEQYTIDRWKGLGNTTVYVENGGIEIAPTASFDRGIKQILDNPGRLGNKTVTFAVKFTRSIGGAGIYINDGEETGISISEPGIYAVTKTIRSDVTSLFVQIGANGMEDIHRVGIEWAALYEGEYTAETLPEYWPKGYGVELMECKRYYQRVGKLQKTGAIALGFCYSSTSARFVMPISPMRIKNPTVTMVSSDSNMPAINCNNSIVARGNFAFTAGIYKDDVQMSLDVTIQGGTTNAPALFLSNSSCCFELVADL